MRSHYENAGQAFNEETQIPRIQDRFDCAQIVQYAGQDIGLFKVDKSTSPWMLCQIQIAPNHQKSCLGTFLIKRLLKEAKRAGAPVTLKVLKVNSAKKFYEKLGFSQTGENDNSYFMAKAEQPD